MNLTIPLVLSHFAPTELTSSIISRIAFRYFRNRGDVLVFQQRGVNGNGDSMVETVLGNLHRKSDYCLSVFAEWQSDLPIKMAHSQGMMIELRFTKSNYEADLKNFLIDVIRSVHFNLRILLMIKQDEFVSANDVVAIFGTFQELNLENVIIINAAEKPTHAGVRVFHRRLDRDFKRSSNITADDILRVTIPAASDDGTVSAILKRNKEIFTTAATINIYGDFLKVSVAVTPPFVWIQEDYQLLETANNEVLNSKMSFELNSNALNGIEIHILREFRQKYNLSGYYNVHPSEIMEVGEMDNKTDSYGVLEETALGISDIAIGGNLANEDLHMYFDPSSWYMEDNMYWFVPAPTEIPRWKNMYMIFEPRMWIAMIAVQLTASAVLFGKLRIESIRSRRKEFSMVMLAIFSNIVVQPVPTRISVRVRCLFAAGFIYGLHISVLYHSSLTSILADRKYEEPIRSLEEVKERNLMLCISGITYDFFKYLSVSSSDSHLEHIVELNYLNCLDKTARERNFVSLVPEKTTEYTIQLRYLDENFAPTVRKMRGRIIRYPVSMYLTKGSRFGDKLSSLIIMLRESGIVEKWWNDIRFSKVRWKGKGSGSGREFRRISLRNATGIFFVFIISLSIASSAFVLELIWRKGRPSKENRK